MGESAQLVDLREGTWEEAESWVGRELAQYEGADEVTIGGIRRRLEVLAWDCPLHYDEAVAREHGYRTIVSPATMLMTWAMPPYWKPGDARPQLDDPAFLPSYPFTKIPAPGEFIFATESDTEYFNPVYPGDRITATSVLCSLTRKRLSVGDGAFFLIETTYAKQTSDVVGIERLTVFRYSA